MIGALTETVSPDRGAAMVTPAWVNPARAADHRAYRLSALDTLRGLVIVIMALDHVRDFVMLAAEQDRRADGLLMTLGPAAVLCAFVDRWSGAFNDVFIMFGRVPFA